LLSGTLQQLWTRRLERLPQSPILQVIPLVATGVQYRVATTGVILQDPTTGIVVGHIAGIRRWLLNVEGFVADGLRVHLQTMTLMMAGDRFLTLTVVGKQWNLMTLRIFLVILARLAILTQLMESCLIILKKLHRCLSFCGQNQKLFHRNQ
jgi:hypothetical protein